ncbi:MAG: hypothetical protein AAFR76_01405 [Planctomycetota bacterium]
MYTLQFSYTHHSERGGLPQQAVRRRRQYRDILWCLDRLRRAYRLHQWTIIDPDGSDIEHGVCA